jgi:hypothetical protein
MRKDKEQREGEREKKHRVGLESQHVFVAVCVDGEVSGRGIGTLELVQRLFKLKTSKSQQMQKETFFGASCI